MLTTTRKTRNKHGTLDARFRHGRRPRSPTSTKRSTFIETLHIQPERFATTGADPIVGGFLGGSSRVRRLGT
ncbi:hypothetical protein GCM10007298_20950 [Williamsia phyllosphaerae]|uniref:Uncharacterized protein n=1 Tax=Williamsia phyllosphaerae TaxID=885042 RepID=A0ABQ1UQN9_9NOCA|nr:hypothetical protein GCM10007298_20950 [Williamsia phyllosphaerae]